MPWSKIRDTKIELVNDIKVGMKDSLPCTVCLLLMFSGVHIHAQTPDLAKPIVDSERVFEENGGLVAVEAENFYKQTKTGKRQWYRSGMDSAEIGPNDMAEKYIESASGKGYIEILPDTRKTHDDELIRGENFSNVPGILGVLHYKVKIKEPGRYYVWVRAYSSGSEDNGIHVGLNGKWPENGQRMQWCEGKNEWTWDSKQRTKEQHCGVPHQIYLDIDSAGNHEIQFSMREDGFVFDKFLLTKDRNYVPEGKAEQDNGNEISENGAVKKKSSIKIKPPKGRLAIVADGNSPDPDDLGATAVSIALLSATGQEKRLVHYSHSCDLKRGDRISEDAEKERHALMQSACDVTARRWGGFDGLTFFDAKWNQGETVRDLSEKINSSTEEDPLWIIEAGEPDIIGMALEGSKKSKHKFVKVVTHHPANDDAGDFYTWQQILDFGVEEVRIPDQNTHLKVDLNKWDWAKNHDDPKIQWVWLQGKIAEVDDVVTFQKGKWDCSDAGMILYWLTGATDGGLEMGNVDDVKSILLDYIDRP